MTEKATRILMDVYDRLDPVPTIQDKKKLLKITQECIRDLEAAEKLLR